MKDLFEEMRNFFNLEYISDLPFYGDKELIGKLLHGLPEGMYSEREIQRFKDYIFRENDCEQKNKEADSFLKVKRYGESKWHSINAEHSTELSGLLAIMDSRKQSL